MKELTLYSKLDTRIEVCNLGCKHEVTILEVKRVRHVGTYTGDNGYQEFEGGIYLDAQGREYREYRTIDFFNNVCYLRSNDAGKNDFFYTRPRACLRGTEPIAEDVRGRRIKI